MATRRRQPLGLAASNLFVLLLGCARLPVETEALPPAPPAAVAEPKQTAPVPVPVPRPSGAVIASAAMPDLSGAVPVRLWATFYSVPVVDPLESGGVPLRDMSGRRIGPALTPRDWCRTAMEGTVRVGGKVYNYAGTRAPAAVKCKHRPSGTVRWRRAPHPFGTGARGNALVPFRTLACDIGTVRGSRPWVKGGYAKFGQRVFIPAAVGLRLPDGSVHDGMFHCGDVGGKITGNHIDVFLGEVRGGLPAALRLNPFPFIASNSRKTFQAYLLPME